MDFPNIGDLAAGSSASLQVLTTIPGPGAHTAAAFADSVTADPNLNNNHAQDVLLPAPAAAGPYGFVSVAETPTFGIPGGNAPVPAIDGGKVVFVTNDVNNDSILWSANADGTGLTRLVDAATAMPGGAGDTFSAIQYVRLRDGIAAFIGFGHTQNDGIFAVPVGGGTVKQVVGPGFVRPDNPTKTFGYQDLIQSFAGGTMGDGTIGFQAQGGVYAYSLFGAPPQVLAYPGTAFQGASNRTINQFFAPAFSGSRAVIQGVNSELITTFLDEHRFVATVDLNTPPPAGTTWAFNNGDTFTSAQVEGDTVVFRGLSGGPSPVKVGVYSRTGFGPVVTLVDQNTPIPGGTGNFASLASDVVGLNAGEVLFAGADSAGRAGL